MKNLLITFTAHGFCTSTTLFACTRFYQYLAIILNENPATIEQMLCVWNVQLASTERNRTWIYCQRTATTVTYLPRKSHIHTHTLYPARCNYLLFMITF